MTTPTDRALVLLAGWLDEEGQWEPQFEKLSIETEALLRARGWTPCAQCGVFQPPPAQALRCPRCLQGTTNAQ